MSEMKFKDSYTCPRCENQFEVIVTGKQHKEFTELIAVHKAQTSEELLIEKLDIVQKNKWMDVICKLK